MAYEFKRLADVEALGEVPENATVLAEVNGSIKRIPGKGLGGGNSVILTQIGGSSGDSAPMIAVANYKTFEANMDFADAVEAFRAGEIGGAMVYYAEVGGGGEVTAMSTRMQTFVAAGPSYSSYAMADLAIIQDASPYFGVDCLVITTMYNYDSIFWTANGISTEEPWGGTVE